MSNHHHVYVIELDPGVLNERRFTEENPDHDPTLACLYVGMTGRTPEQRFAQHLAGYKSSKYPRRYGMRLCPAAYEGCNPMTFPEAQAMEKQLADELRAAGHAVWQR